MNENRKDSMPIADTNPPRILVLGSTGRTGGAVATQIEADHHDVVVVRAARDQATVDQWRDQGLAAARLDLDDARTFPAALDGIDRLFVMTGYTVAMTHQTKMITDAAADAGVGHLVHLGIFGDGRSTEPHFAWHELVERYIEGSGIAWTHLHPHMFMENLLTTFPLRDWRFTWPAGDKPCGLIAGEDLAAVAAKVLAEGPDAHAGQGYWLSTDVLDGKGIAGALTSALGRPIAADIITPDDLRAAIGPASCDRLRSWRPRTRSAPSSGSSSSTTAAWTAPSTRPPPSKTCSAGCPPTSRTGPRCTAPHCSPRTPPAPLPDISGTRRRPAETCTTHLTPQGENAMDLRLTDQVIVVTGAASGIGQATARLLSEEGAVVVGVDRDPVDAGPAPGLPPSKPTSPTPPRPTA